MLFLKVKLFGEQLRERRNELSGLEEDGQTDTAKKLQKHRMRLVKAHRTIWMIYASIAVGVAECLPIGVLQGTPCAGLHAHFGTVWLALCSHLLETCGKNGPAVHNFSHHHMVVVVD